MRLQKVALMRPFVHAGSPSRAWLSEVLQACAVRAAEVVGATPKLQAADESQPCNSESWGNSLHAACSCPRHGGVKGSEALLSLQVSPCAQRGSKDCAVVLAARLLSRTSDGASAPPIFVPFSQLIGGSEINHGITNRRAYTTAPKVSKGSPNLRLAEHQKHHEFTGEEELETVTTKVCSDCQREKSLRNFTRLISSPDGHHFLCRACNAEWVARRSGRTYKHLGLSRTESLERSKTCRSCLERKEARDFCLDRRNRDGLNALCRACDADKFARYRGTAVRSHVESQPCVLCGQEKPSLEYYPSLSHPSGRDPLCKLCNKERQRCIRGKALKFGVPQPVVEAKICTRCNSQKNAAEFNRHKGRADGLENICRTCRRQMRERVNLKKVDG